MNESAQLEVRRPFLTWYLTKFQIHEVLFSFLSGATVFLMILLLFQAIRVMEFVVVHQVGIRDVAKVFYFMGMSFTPLAAPVAFLFAVLMGTSRANSEGEILAMQVNGISLRQIFAPIGCFSVLLSGVVLYTSLYTVPQANRSFELLYTRLENERVIATLKPGVFIDGFYGLMLFTEHIVPLKNELKRVFLYDRREENRPLAITAQAGLLKNQPEKGILTLRLTDGSIHVETNKADDPQQKIEFDVYDINLNLGVQGEAWRAYSPPSFTGPQLVQRIRETEHDAPEHRRLQVEYHRRITMAFSCMVFAALGFSIGILSQRGVRSSAIMMCLGTVLAYWCLYLVANTLSIGGWAPAWLALWLPNIAFSGLSYFCYRQYTGGT